MRGAQGTMDTLGPLFRSYEEFPDSSGRELQQAQARSNKREALAPLPGPPRTKPA